MGGSTFGNNFKITTWGESHGEALGVVIDGCPAGLSLTAEDIMPFMNRRRPGQSGYTTPRNESDSVKILSGVFEGKTTGTPISIAVFNENQHSHDYSAIKDVYRPGHADFGFDAKYGFRDYRGGGRSSGRETIGRVAAGAVASKILSELGITVHAYAEEIGGVKALKLNFEEETKNPFFMPDLYAADAAAKVADEAIKNQDSLGGVICCRVTGMPAGIGEPVFDKLDANLSKAVMSVGAVKGVEIGDGFKVSAMRGSENNDEFVSAGGSVSKATNHSGGILGGMSDGSEIILRAAVKPTPSIASTQKTVNSDGENVEINIKGRHDPLVVPRAVVVVESMVAITVLDALISNMSAKLSGIKDFYKHQSDFK